MAISSALAGTVGQVPAGALMPFAGASSPSGWLLCAGQAVSRTQFSSLFLTIGTTYGVGDGSTTFNLPDLRGRVVAGLDNMGGSTASRLTATTITGGADGLGEVGGAETHTLTSAEMPSHTHTQNAHAHSASHTFGLRYGSSSSTHLHDANRNVSGGPIGGGTGPSSPSVSVANNTATNQNTGGGGAHNNVQPTMVLNYIIKA